MSAFSAREDRRHVSVAEGVYLLKYVSSAARESAPVARINDAGDPALAVLAAPGLPDAALRAPGDYVVLRVSRRTRLEISIKARHPGGSIDAELELQPIAPAIHRVEPAATAPSRAVARDGLSVLAHVARRGDVSAKAMEWICGPDLPMAIEGFELRWPGMPSGLALTYAAVVGRQRQALPDCGIGQFAGTRGRATPVVGLRAALAGPAAERFVLRVEALFLGGAVVSQAGRTIALSGPSGREPLVGLKVGVEPVAAAASRPAVNPPSAFAEQPAARARRPAKPVQVFRSRALTAAAS